MIRIVDNVNLDIERLELWPTLQGFSNCTLTQPRRTHSSRQYNNIVGVGSLGEFRGQHIAQPSPACNSNAHHIVRSVGSQLMEWPVPNVGTLDHLNTNASSQDSDVTSADSESTLARPVLPHSAHHVFRTPETKSPPTAHKIKKRYNTPRAQCF